MQNIVDLNRFIRDTSADHGKLKTTIAQFFRISGGSNQFKGVVPDIIFPTAKLNTEKGERGLHNALPWDHVEPARFRPANAPVNEYNRVRELSKKRIKSDQLFQLLLEQQKIIYNAEEQKTISLVESKREKERDELNETTKRLQNEFRVAQGLKPLPENADEEEYEKVEPVDVLLQETAHILWDLIVPSHKTAANTTPS